MSHINCCHNYYFVIGARQEIVQFTSISPENSLLSADQLEQENNKN